MTHSAPALGAYAGATPLGANLIHCVPRLGAGPPRRSACSE